MTQSLQGGKLRLIQAYVGPNFLSRLSLRCPYLDLLEFTKTTFVDQNGSRMNQLNNVTIIMPSTKFRKIKWCTVEGNASRPVNTHHFKVVKGSRTYYFKGDNTSSTHSDCSQEDCERPLHDSNIFCLHLERQAVE